VRRWFHVKANDIAQLFNKMRVVAKLEVGDAVRLKLVSLPNALNGAEAHPFALGHFARTPVRAILRDCTQRRFNDLGNFFLRDGTGPPRPRGIF
jgi:hypothetical protein